MRVTIGSLVFACGVLLVISEQAAAEPYIAVMTGFSCGQCHTNAAGGGKRTVFGTAYAQSQLARSTLSVDGNDAAWNGEVNRWLAVGADLRTGIDYVDTPGAAQQSEFGISRGAVYGELRAIPNLLSFYLDEQFAPGGALTREAYALVKPGGGRYRIKAGKFFLPYGLRLQDDTAFVRELTALNFTTPDNGAEFGLELPRWSAQLAISNGTAGGPDNDNGKQTSASATYIVSRWRIGASYNSNNAALGDRQMGSIFAGIRTGPIAWLAELDRITDDVPGSGDQDIDVSLLEGNWRIGKGHNVKLTYEFHDPTPGADDDERERYSLVWEYSPFQLLQSRIGIRAYHGVRNVAATNRNEVFAELHGFF